MAENKPNAWLMRNRSDESLHVMAFGPETPKSHFGVPPLFQKNIHWSTEHTTYLFEAQVKEILDGHLLEPGEGPIPLNIKRMEV